MDTNNLSDYTLEELNDFIVSEDYELLDELTKKTLGNYIRKASSDVKHLSNQQGREDAREPNVSKRDTWSKEKASKRLIGIKQAVHRLTKENDESLLDLVSDEHLEEFLQTEEYEQLDEISKKTLGSYIHKATARAAEHDSHQKELRAKADGIRSATSSLTTFHSGVKADKERNDVQDAGSKLAKSYDNAAEGHGEKAFKRRWGTMKAMKKLTKEDVAAMVDLIRNDKTSDAIDLFDSIMDSKAAEQVDGMRAGVQASFFKAPDETV